MKKTKQEYQREWYIKNKDRILIEKKALYNIDIEKSRNKVKTAYYKHREKRIADIRLDRKLNPDKYKNQDLKKVFGITLIEYKLMLENQQHKCKICNKHKNEFKKQLAVDHCHSTGRIRGLLCEKCNVGLGSFKDNIEVLTQAIEYLKGK